MPGQHQLRPDLPGDGFLVVIGQPGTWVLDGSPYWKEQAPLSQGAAVRRIRLFEIPTLSDHYLEIHSPPAELPQRYVFFREEMGDAIIGDPSTCPGG